MSLRRFAVFKFFVGLIVMGTGVVCAQDYPTKPIRIVTSEAGAANDFAARLVAQGLSERWGQPVIVDNRPSGPTPGAIVSQARPDGYTLLAYGDAFWTAPLLQEMPYSPSKDFSPIGVVASSPNILVVNPSLSVNSVQELIAFAKASPGVLNYASASTGSPNHIAAELFKAMAGVNFVRIPYKSTAPGLVDVIAGRVQLMFPPVASSVQQVKSGKLKALAVTSARPSTLVPGLPTIAATLPGYEAVSTYAMFAPAKTPEAIIRRLNQELVRGLNTPETKEKLFAQGLETVASSPEQLTATMKSQVAKLSKSN